MTGSVPPPHPHPRPTNRVAPGTWNEDDGRSAVVSGSSSFLGSARHKEHVRSERQFGLGLHARGTLPTPAFGGSYLTNRQRALSQQDSRGRREHEGTFHPLRLTLRARPRSGDFSENILQKNPLTLTFFALTTRMASRWYPSATMAPRRTDMALPRAVGHSSGANRAGREQDAFPYGS
jgi:hypothetical protein